MPISDTSNISHRRWPEWVGYPFTILVTAGLTIGLITLERYLPLSNYPIYYIILLPLVAYWFGEGPAVLAFVLGLAAVDLFFTDHKVNMWLPANRDGWARLISFLVGAVTVGMLTIYTQRSRKKTEDMAQLLRESVERFRSLVETTSDWIWEVNAQGVYTYVSPRIKDLLGYEPSEIVGKTPMDLMTPDEVERLTPIVKHHLENAIPFVNLQNMNLHKDGRLVLLETSGVPIFDEQGILTGYRGIDRDITERKQAEDALKESEYRYAAAQRAANIGSWDWYIQTGALVWSDRIEPMFGFAHGEFRKTYESFLECIHPDDRQFLTDSVDAALRGERDYAIEHRIVWPDGTVRWLAEKGEVYHDENGVPVRMFGIVQDITERKEAELALQESEERFRSIVETTNEWIWSVDVGGQHVYSNPAVEEILGYRPDEIVGKGILTFIHEDDRTLAQQTMTDAIEKKRGWSELIIRWKHKDGSYRWLESNAVPFFDDKGEVLGFRGADRDITRRKEAEEALYETSQRLTLHVENSPLAVIELDAELRISRWTEGSEKMFGWSTSEVIGKSLDDLDIVYKEDHEAVRTMMEKLRDGRIPRAVNKNRNYRKDGSVIYCEWYNSALFDSSGKFVSVLSMALNVTEEVILRGKLENQVQLLQQALVPSEPVVVEGYTAAAIYLPAYVGQEIGGDFYDSFLTETGMIGVVIGDVAGKGIEAASLAATARSTIRAFAYELASIAQALSHTNAVLCAQKGDSDKFVTVFAVVIAPVTGEFDYAGAGHPPAAVCRTNGSVEFLGVGNPPVGILDKRIFTSIQGLLNPGDKIVLYTDGILEARRGQEFFELEGISRTLEEHGHKRPAEVAQELLRAAQEWSGSELQDDAAIVVVERNT